MNKRHRLAGITRFVLLALPVVAVALWIGSGRETFTKHAKVVQVEARDDVFGDAVTEARIVRGPILGYFVGLDIVIVSAAASLVIGMSAGILRRRAQKRFRRETI